ncbi:transcriptional regulator with XRE-family HTH domain [Paenibacillus sp. 1182]|uniref:helix-turn-helix domain-containing protein n=1 Tax=Paenibacillus sp. 1182 TaxID=2806565 RepID=UPI001B548C5D|nr:helix-turn-helix transcriptional regulator [Paenibacillus sp. 1182]MBP1309050.1 transcriptional regulator with XRE-family HTH domain [Paenibacillus sp. 1182]
MNKDTLFQGEISLFHTYFQQMRLDSGYKNQKDLANRSNISAATISRIEKGEQTPTIETLKIIAPFLPSTTLHQLMTKAGYLEPPGTTDNDLTWKERALQAENEVKTLKKELLKANNIKRFGEGIVEGDIIEFNHQSELLYIYHKRELIKISVHEFNYCIGLIPDRRWEAISQIR